jgi:hypothetical protein
MNNNYSMFKIKLKTGFFKKESYFLILGDQEIILRNESKEESEEFRIEKSVLKSVVISGENPLDIEIIKADDVFSGEFLSTKDLAEAAVELNLFCGEKLDFH